MKNIALYLFCTFLVTTSAIVTRSSLLDSKIIGGESTDISYKKFMASLRIKEKHFCCGFLVSMRIVMTTGFCANYMKSHSKPDYTDATVFFGNANLSETELATIVHVDHAKHHQDYDPDDSINTGSNDIGYVLLAKQLSKSKKFSIVSILPNDLHFKTQGEIYGWGSVELQDPKAQILDVPMSKTLKKIKIKTVGHDVCGISLKRSLKAKQMCGIGYNEGETAALGDAGSPLIRNKKYVAITSLVNLIGLVHPIVFIKSKPFSGYIDDLQKEFPDDESELIDNDKKKTLKAERVHLLKKAFQYETNDDGKKLPKCIICLDSKGSLPNIKKIGNRTRSLKHHLKKYHQNLYGGIFGESSYSNTQI